MKMHCLLLDLYENDILENSVDESKDSSNARKGSLDTQDVLRRLSNLFSNIVIRSNDPLIFEAEGAEKFFYNKEMLGANDVIASLYRKAKDFGPATIFTIPLSNSERIIVVLRRYDLKFIYSENVPSAVKEKIKEFLSSFSGGTVSEFDVNIPKNYEALLLENHGNTG